MQCLSWDGQLSAPRASLRSISAVALCFRFALRRCSRSFTCREQQPDPSRPLKQMGTVGKPLNFWGNFITKIRMEGTEFGKSPKMMQCTYKNEEI